MYNDRVHILKISVHVLVLKLDQGRTLEITELGKMCSEIKQ